MACLCHQVSETYFSSKWPGCPCGYLVQDFYTSVCEPVGHRLLRQGMLMKQTWLLGYLLRLPGVWCTAVSIVVANQNLYFENRTWPGVMPWAQMISREAQDVDEGSSCFLLVENNVKGWSPLKARSWDSPARPSWQAHNKCFVLATQSSECQPCQGHYVLARHHMSGARFQGWACMWW